MNYPGHIPLIRLVVPLCLGILIQIRLGPELSLSLIIFTLCLLILFWIQKKAKVYVPLLNGTISWILCFCLGVLLFNTHSSYSHRSYFLKKQDHGRYLMELTEDSKPGTYGTSLSGDVFYCIDSMQNSKGKIALFVNKDSLNFYKGSKLAINLDEQKEVRFRHPFQFDFEKYLSTKGIYENRKLNPEQLKVRPELLAEQSLRKRLLDRLNEIYRNAIADPECRSVILALAIGDKSGLESDTRDRFAETGLIHTLAVSGLHVGIIYMILTFMLRLGKGSLTMRALKVLTAVFFLLGYAWITGFSPSVSRSVFMFCCLLAGTSLKRTGSVMNTLLFSALILLIINPFLLFDAGFQLSYSAVIGIVLAGPIIKSILPHFLRWNRSLAELTAVSCSAQLGTLPISLFYFHQFPNYFLIANLLVLPFIPVILVLGLAIIPASFMSESFSVLIGNCLSVYMHFIFWLIDGIQNLPNGLTRGLRLNGWELVLSYIFIIATLLWIRTGKKYLLLVLCIGLSCYALWNSTEKADYYKIGNGNTELYFLNYRGCTYIMAEASSIGSDYFRHRILKPIRQYYGDEVRIIPKLKANANLHYSNVEILHSELWLAEGQIICWE